MYSMVRPFFLYYLVNMLNTRREKVISNQFFVTHAHSCHVTSQFNNLNCCGISTERYNENVQKDRKRWMAEREREGDGKRYRVVYKYTHLCYVSGFLFFGIMPENRYYERESSIPSI